MENSYEYGIDVLHNSLQLVFGPNVHFRKPSPVFLNKFDLCAYLTLTSDTVVPTTVDQINHEFNVLQSNTVLSFEKLNLVGNRISLTLAKDCLFKSVISSILCNGVGYGQRLTLNKKIHLKFVNNDPKESETLWDLRIKLLKRASSNIFTTLGYTVVDTLDSEEDSTETLLFSAAKENSKGYLRVICNKVVDKSDENQNKILVLDYQRLREHDMRSILTQKYWQSVDEDTVIKLTDAVITLELLQSCPKVSIKVTTEIQTQSARSGSNKGGAYILYNIARINSIEKSFKRGFPDLPPPEQIDFRLLSQNEEWRILFDFLFEYPMILKDCISQWEHGFIYPNRIYNFLLGLSHLLSSYYSRVKILQDPKPHLLSIVFARVTLFKAIKQVMLNGLDQLNVKSVENM